MTMTHSMHHTLHLLSPCYHTTWSMLVVCFISPLKTDKTVTTKINKILLNFKVELVYFIK